ncbi:hypothetical protein CCAN12_580007 [Capnocytophaga canimorsus]|uniref:Uncharacterized protein n=1 Tax=Capnocytophaga canimorsus TaxID=28188 RepID=A0A0B7H6F6_9FLAO|nr:hypothetical protein CCAN12_580007 [Capnocytophaga canimorsus]
MTKDENLNLYLKKKNKMFYGRKIIFIVVVFATFISCISTDRYHLFFVRLS